MHLDRAVDDPTQRVGDEVLRHRDLGDKVELLVDPVGGVQHHELRLVELHRRVGDHPLDALLLGEHRTVREALERARDHHVERRLGLGDPAHAVGEARRAESVLAEPVPLPAAAEHVRSGHAQLLDPDLGVAGAAVHRLDLAYPVPARRGDVDDEAGIGGLRHVGPVLGARDQDREARAARIRDEPLVTVDHPVVAVLDRAGLDEGRIRAGDLRFGHREATHRDAVAQRSQVLLLLGVGRPVEQGVHVALVGRLAVEHPRAVVGLGGFGLHHRQVDVAESHAAPLARHVGQPETGGLRLGAHVDQDLQVLAAFDVVAVADLRLAGLDHGLDELADPEPEVLQFGTQREIDGHARVASFGGGAGRGATGCDRPYHGRALASRASRPGGPMPASVESVPRS